MISAAPSQTIAASLLVFSDDWGRHPSSCQHLVSRLLDRLPVTWVNTIGTRAPRLDRATLLRVHEKVRQWTHHSGNARRAKTRPVETGSQPTVISPMMWPWFGSRNDRRLNRWLLQRQLTPLIERMPQPVVGLTTLPITADLPDALPVSRWLYYCVDDFSQWPGLDGSTLRGMDSDMIRRADSVIAVSETLQAMIAAEGRSAELLTHGVDVDFWNVNAPQCERVRNFDGQRPASGPRIVYWGLLDRRMSSESLIRLSRDLQDGTIVLIGPQQDPDPVLLSLPNVKTLPPVSPDQLPQIAASSDVLIMPYADLPVTRAMQPLKLKEYLATGKPVVVNRLPSTEPWSDCLDTADSAADFSRIVRERLMTGIPESQRMARQRLRQESWQDKAECLWRMFNESEPISPPEWDRLGPKQIPERPESLRMRSF